MSYIGNEPIVSATRTVTEITATAGQTVFTANGGYTVGYLDVFVNGAQLQNTDFTATNGSTITLVSAAQAGDDIRLVAWGTFSTGTHVLKAGDTMSGSLGVLGRVLVGAGTNNTNYPLQVNGTGGTAGDVSMTSDGTRAEIQSFNNKPLHINRQGNPVIIGADLQFNSGFGSSAIAYGCRAWVNFNGTGTVAIRASGNVSSITDNGAGDYTVNFATAMPDTNYVVTGLGGLSSVTWGFVIPCGLSGLGTTNPNSTTQTRFRTVTPQDGALDNLFCNVAIFR